MRLFLIDGIGPFFRGCRRRRMNWSKIPFDELERNGPVGRRLRKIAPDVERFVRKSAQLGRTWTVGAHRVGDLIWNRNTFDKVFTGLDSPRLVISMKYGESDFFRFLPLNKLFFRSNHLKIVEFQARREYEGAGQYPSFIGWDYEQYVRQLAGARNIIGAWIWTQTGGWSVFRRLTYLPDSSVWNELNSLRKLLRCLVEDPHEAILQGYSALRKIDRMRELAGRINLPTEDLAFQYDTFEILATAREYYFGPYTEDTVRRLRRLERRYRNTYTTRYSVRLDFSPFAFPRSRIRLLLSVWLRQKRGYRLVDRILMIRALSLLSPVFLLTRHKPNADVLNHRAMGIATINR